MSSNDPRIDNQGDYTVFYFGDVVVGIIAASNYGCAGCVLSVFDSWESFIAWYGHDPR